MSNYGLIGDRISRSFSSELHNEFSRQLKLENTFEKIIIKAHELDAFIKKNSFDGFNVTIPHKETIIPLLDQLSPVAETLGAVNCVENSLAGLIGHNTDWLGFKTALNINHIHVSGKNCLILGAGGAARAIIYTLNKLGVGSIKILNRHYDRALILAGWAENINKNKTEAVLFENINFSEINIIINCTPQGMQPEIDDCPLDPDYIKSKHLLIDTVYNPLETKWLRAGQEKGALTLGGLDMFIHQGLASAKIWDPDLNFENINLHQIKKALIWES